jgi:hypothetical protein
VRKHPFCEAFPSTIGVLRHRFLSDRAKYLVFGEQIVKIRLPIRPKRGTVGATSHHFVDSLLIHLLPPSASA